jgi:hypothetical protein
MKWYVEPNYESGEVTLYFGNGAQSITLDRKLEFTIELIAKVHNAQCQTPPSS